MVASAGTTQEEPVTPGDPVQSEQQDKLLSSPGQRYATEARKGMIDRMVRQQIENERSIVLAVMPCHSGPTTERILEFAKVADPCGERTLGVFTKPDLVKEQAMFQSVQKHIKQSPLKLGYLVVRSRRANEDDLELTSLRDKEQELFVGPEPGPTSQREYLVRLASRFQLMTHNSLEGQYVHPDFSQHTNLRLVSLVINMNEVFAELMRRSGHKYRFHGFELCWLGGSDLMNKVLRTTPHPLSNIIPVKFFQNQMPKDGLEGIIEEHYLGFKGPKLGTFGGSVLTIFDKEVAQQLWENAMHDQLDEAYKGALAHAEFLVDSELLGRPYTYNHYFNENLERARSRRIAATQAQKAHAQPSATTAAAAEFAKSDSSSNSSSIKVKISVPLQQPSKTHADQVKENIDVLKSYYKIARKRFVDAICQQVVSLLLLNGDESPLNILCPELIAKLTDNQLEQIAGEDSASRSMRQGLDEEIEGLKAAMEVFRT
ncbi:hypothetical protein B0T09DRAFT_398779 [Sordaria sp. MPI-SDFR-AT-0083]|nr:hypothetical protein B0T09DRAFT_398779 [Sordaria sp. MPI-SDFR-AT-0083]